MALHDMTTLADALRWALSRITPDNRGDYFDRAQAILVASLSSVPAAAPTEVLPEAVEWETEDGTERTTDRDLAKNWARNVGVRVVRRAAPAAAPVGMSREIRMAVMLAYGHLWHVNNEPMAPIPMYSPEKAAYEARKQLRDLLTNQERGEAINQVGVLIGRYDVDGHAAESANPPTAAPVGEREALAAEAAIMAAALKHSGAVGHSTGNAEWNALRATVRAALAAQPVGQVEVGASDPSQMPAEREAHAIFQQWARGEWGDRNPPDNAWLCFRAGLLAGRTIAEDAQPVGQSCVPSSFEGQGLDCYWKWGYAAGWNDHKRHVAATPPVAPATPEGVHDNLRDNIGQAISDKLTEWYGTEDGTLGVDPFDSRNIDEMADAVIAAIAPSAAPVAPDLTGERLTDMAHAAFEEAMAFGVSADSFIRLAKSVAAMRGAASHNAQPTAAKD